MSRILNISLFPMDAPYIEGILFLCYNVMMRFAFIHHHLVRQILGGLAGMAIAALLYVVFQQVSDLGGNRAMLVDTPTIARTSGTVRVNDTNPDPNELRKVAEHAREIAAAMSSAAPAPSAPAPKTVIAEPSFPIASSPMARAERIALQRSQHSLMVDAATLEPTQENRIAFRNAVAASARANTLHPTATPEGPAAPPSPIPVEPSTPSEQVSVSSALPNSGVALNFLVVASLVGALLHVHPRLRRRLASTLLGEVQ
jgi:hypothetical protein